MFYWRIDRAVFGAAPILFFAAVLLASCESERPPAAFYPIDSLVTAQVVHLLQTNAGLFKEVLLGGKNDTVTYRPDSLSWTNELDIFRKLDLINKPVNKGNYNIDDVADAGSNLKVKAFTRKDDEEAVKLPLVYLKIYYQGTIAKPRKIEALYDEGNPLYESARLLSMHFQQIENQTVLTSYSIRGGQKMVFADSVAFYVGGKILVN
jgi:hypothetical protein